MTSRLLVSVAAASALLSVAGGTVLAGEITGNGRLKDVQGRSACANSGQEDLQWFFDDLDMMPREVVVRGVPGHAQSWGQIDKETRALLTSIGMNPGIACNPNKSTGEG
jgi:hypothetical protein